MSSPPASPEIAYLWRRFVSARDAINYFRLDDPGLPDSVSDASAELQRLRRTHFELVNRDKALHVELGNALAPIYEADAKKTHRPPGSWERVVTVRDQIAAILDDLGDVMRKSRVVRQHLTREERKAVGAKILRALGEYPFDYSAARSILRDGWDESLKATGQEQLSLDSDDPRDLVRYQLTKVIEPLLTAYENPNRFFREILPDLELYVLSEENFRGHWHLGTWTDGRPVWPFTPLAELLHRWGYGVLLNPDVKAIFEKAAAESTFSLVLAQAEGKRAFRDVGPLLKVDYVALRREYAAVSTARGARAKWKRAKAKELDIEPSSLARYLSPSFGKKR